MVDNAKESAKIASGLAAPGEQSFDDKRRAAVLRASSNALAFGWEEDEEDLAEGPEKGGDKNVAVRIGPRGVERFVDDAGRIDTTALADSLVLMPDDVQRALTKGRVDVWSGLREVLDEGWKLMIPASVMMLIQPEPKWFVGASKRVRITPDVRHVPSERRVSEVPVIVEQRVRTYGAQGGSGRRRVELKVNMGFATRTGGRKPEKHVLTFGWRGQAVPELVDCRCAGSQGTSWYRGES